MFTIARIVRDKINGLIIADKPGAPLSSPLYRYMIGNRDKNGKIVLKFLRVEDLNEVNS
jgi:hypothetical protein